ncbi:MAG TPA: NADH-quinone oxidoreductase subunit M [Gammaproteobacteria bacterium]
MNTIHWSEQSAYPVLALLQLLPLAGALLVGYLRERPYAALLGRALALLVLLVAIDLYRLLDKGSASLQLAEYLPLLGPFAYHAAADGVTVLFVLLAALLTFLLSLYTAARQLEAPGLLLAVILLLEAVLLSLLVSTNLLWFVLASALELGLAGYLLWRWATTPERGMALLRFYQFQGTGLLLLLLGTLMLAWHYADTAGHWSFELTELTQASFQGPLATLIFFLLFYGLAIRSPLFPFHGWLPLVAHRGNVAIAPAFLLGVKVGLYGMVRFVFPILPQAVVEWHGYAVAFAVAGVFYAAFLAFQQQNLRRLMAFAVVSHTSLAVIGLFALHKSALQGALLLAVNFGLAATAMLFITGFVYSRTNTTVLSRLGGLFDRIPFLAITFLASGLAIIGMPGTPGYDAAHLVLEASIEEFGALLTVAAAVGNVAAAGFLLYAFQRAFLAPAPEGSESSSVERATSMELLVAVLVLAVLLGTGFYSEPWMALVDAPLQALGAQFDSFAPLSPEVN